MKRVRKTKAQRIYAALEELNRAMSLEDPHIRISLPWGVQDDDQGKEFIKSLKTFVQSYKKYYGLEKVDLDLVL
jgi:hypothetical protein